MLTKSIVIAAVLLAPTWARADCLTQSQAKAKWPDEHLVWRSENKCWMPKRLAKDPRWHTPADRPLLPVGQIEAKAPTTGDEMEIYFPTLQAGNILDGYPLIYPQPWLAPDSMRNWPLLLDVDRIPFAAWDRRIGQ